MHIKSDPTPKFCPLYHIILSWSVHCAKFHVVDRSHTRYAFQGFDQLPKKFEKSISLQVYVLKFINFFSDHAYNKITENVTIPNLRIWVIDLKAQALRRSMNKNPPQNTITHKTSTDIITWNDPWENCRN